MYNPDPNSYTVYPQPQRPPTFGVLPTPFGGYPMQPTLQPATAMPLAPVTTPVPPPNSSCPQGHSLVFGYVGSNWNCDRCKMQSPPGTSYQCRRCNFDVCARCSGNNLSSAPVLIPQLQQQQPQQVQLPLQQPQTFAPMPSPIIAPPSTQSTAMKVCPLGHTLNFSYVGSNWNCDKCRMQSPPGNSYQCRRCNYDVCARCSGQAPTTVPIVPATISTVVPPATSLPFAAQASSYGVTHAPPVVVQQACNMPCPQGHALTFSYVGSSWNCDRCHAQSPPGNSFQCRRCNFDVCTKCAKTASVASLPSHSVTPASSLSVTNNNSNNSSTTTRPTRTKMLLIGINYTGTGSQLSGCVNDVRNMQGLLERLGIYASPNDVRVLVDDPSFPGGRFDTPTRANIEACIRWLVDGAGPGDSLFFHFSGHGSQASDRTGDEDDGFDETLVPLDYNTRGMITDDYLFKNLCATIPRGCRLTGVTDCCHSGSIFDLPFVFHPKAASHRLPPKSRDFRMNAGAAKQQCDGDVLLISGCKDNQTSADVSNVSGFFKQSSAQHASGAGGACTSSLMKVLSHGYGKISYEIVLEQMLVTLDNGNYTQLPQMSSSKNFDFQKPFSFTDRF